MSAIVFVDDKDKLMACHGAIVKVKRCAVMHVMHWQVLG